MLEVLELKMPEDLRRMLERASNHKLTAEEIRQQRISFIMGSLPPESTVTRDMVENFLAEWEGRRAS